MKRQNKTQIEFLLLHIFTTVFLLAELFYSPIYIELAIVILAAAYIIYGACLCVGYLMYGYSHLSDMRLFFGLLSITFGALGIAYNDMIYTNLLLFSIVLLLFSSIFILQRAVNMMRNYKKGGKRALILSFTGIAVTALCILLLQYSPQYFLNKDTISLILLIFNSFSLFVYGIIVTGKQKAISFASKKAQNALITSTTIEDTLEFDALKVKTNYAINGAKENKNSITKEPADSWTILRPCEEELFTKRASANNMHTDIDNIYIYAPLAQEKQGLTDTSADNNAVSPQTSSNSSDNGNETPG